MSRERFIEDLKNYFKEAFEKKWADYILNFDLNRMFDRYDSDFEDSVRDEIECDFRERLERAQDAIDEARDYLDWD